MKLTKSGMKRSIFLSYIFVTLIPLVALGIIFILYNVQLYRQANEYNDYVQNQIGSNVSDILFETQKVSSNIYSITGLQSALDIPSRRMYFTNGTITNVISYLTTAKQYANYVVSIYIYIEKTDSILSEQGVLDSRSYYNINENDGYETYEKWLDALKARPLSKRYEPVSKRDGNYINYFYNVLQTPYILKDSSEIITLVISVPQKEYFRSANDVKWFPYCNSFIFDNENKLLFSKIESENLIQTPNTMADVMQYKNKYKILSSIVSLKTSKWSILTVIDQHRYFNTPLQTLLISTLLLLICLFFCTVIIYFLADKNYKPISDLMKLLGKNDDKNEYETIQNSIMNLISNNEQYATDINQQKKIFRDVLLSKLLNGDFHSEVTVPLSNYDIHFPNQDFAVLIFTSYTIDDMGSVDACYDDLSVRLTKRIEEKLSEYHAVCYIVYEGKQVVCIINLDAHDDITEHLIQIATDGCDYICGNFNINMSAAISNIHPSCFKITKCYFEALEAISYISDEKAGVFLYNSLSEDKKLYFSLKQEQTIINYLQTGNFEEAKEALSVIFSDISTLVPKYTEPILHDIICMFIKIPHIINLRDDADLLSELNFPNFYTHMNNPEDFSSYIFEITKRICDHTLEQKNDMGHQIARNMLSYIEENYTDCNLSIASIADYVHRSTSYVTKQFRAEYNIPISEYISKYRVSVAKRLIENYMPIKDVCINVGYSNIRTFNRIFKSYEKMSPLEYRKTYIENADNDTVS